MFLFIELFQMATFIMLPQYSSMTFYIIDYLYFNFESLVWNFEPLVYCGTRSYLLIKHLNGQITSSIYQDTKDFNASFVPSLCLATIFSFLVTAGRLINSVVFWISFFQSYGLLVQTTCQFWTYLLIPLGMIVSYIPSHDMLRIGMEKNLIENLILVLILTI